MLVRAQQLISGRTCPSQWHIFVVLKWHKIPQKVAGLHGRLRDCIITVGIRAHADSRLGWVSGTRPPQPQCFESTSTTRCQKLGSGVWPGWSLLGCLCSLLFPNSLHLRVEDRPYRLTPTSRLTRVRSAAVKLSLTWICCTADGLTIKTFGNFLSIRQQANWERTKERERGGKTDRL